MFVTDRNLARYLGQTLCVRKCKKIGIENLTIVALKYMQNYPMTMLSCFDFLRQLISERLQGRKNENYVFNNPRIGKASLFSTAADEVNVSEGVLFRVVGRFVRNISGCVRYYFHSVSNNLFKMDAKQNSRDRDVETINQVVQGWSLVLLVV